MDNNWRIAELITKYLREELTEPERNELEAWAIQSTDNRQFFEQYKDDDYVRRELALMDHADTEGTLALTLERMGVEKKPAFRLARMKYVAAAAVLLAVASGAWFLLVKKQTPAPAVATTTPTVMKDVAAGGEKAILTLADGSTIMLDSAANGTLAQQGTVKVSKQDGQLKYLPAAKAAATNTAITYNTVSTPRGGQYQLVLQDGTRIWLNAASTLKFPTAFHGKERVIELNGEGYLEVAPNATMPFKVKVNNMEVDVLGTHFNIMAYNDEPQFKATLLEGRVQVKAATAEQRPVFLTPGQQAQLSRSGTLRVDEHADLEQTMAWKNGMQSFRDADIQTIMRQVSRWYNVEVAYQGDIPAVELTGKIPRTISLRRVLEALELNSGLHFTLADGKVTVAP